MWSFRDWRRKRILARLAIEPALWQSVLDSLPILDGLSVEETVARVQLPEFGGYALFGWVHPSLNVPAAYKDLK